MKKKPGLFDPWRQSASPPPGTASRERPTPDFSENTAPMQTVQFDGLRAGLFVDVFPAEEEGRRLKARATLVDVIHRVYPREAIASILKSWGIYLGAVIHPNPVVLVSGEKKITISSPVGDARLIPHAIDSLSLALREISQQFPDVRDMLGALKVRPYLK